MSGSGQSELGAKPDMVNIEIDGVALQAEKGAMIIHAADEADIYIPRFCYHKKLPIAANCRMCLVQVDKVPKPLPACATPVAEGMKVYTRSEFARKAQQGVMEFLLINHPLDCPICDQGGECELQDLAVGFGRGVSRYAERKRVVKDKNVGSLIATEMTRCIHCTRCIRTLELVSGASELGGIGRGDRTSIGTYIERSIDSEMSGNVIDVCPVGALTAKPSRYRARAWEVHAHPSVAAHDCVGSNIELHTYQNKVLRTVPRENEALNEVWLSDRDRYSYEGLNSEQRLGTPMLRETGNWREVDWNTALQAAATAIKDAAASRPESVGALLSPNATAEEAYLAQKIMRGLGSNNIDHRLRQRDFSDQANASLYPSAGLNIADVQDLDACLLIGSNLRMEQPIVSHRMRKAAAKGADVMSISFMDYDFGYAMAQSRVINPNSVLSELAAVAKALMKTSTQSAPQGLAALVDGVKVGDAHNAIADKLQTGANSALLIGLSAQQHPRLADILALADAIGALSESSVGILSDGANSAGAWLAGAVPHRGAGGQAVDEPGMHAAAMLASPLAAYLIIGAEAERDCADAATAVASLKAASSVVVCTPYITDAMLAYADVLLPVAPFSETSGTFVNAQGDWQSFAGAAKAFGESRPAWKVLRVLGNQLELEEFDYLSSDEVLLDLRQRCASLELTPRAWTCPASLDAASEGLTRLADVPIYSVDGVVRRATALRETTHAGADRVVMNAATADRLGVTGAGRVLVSQGEACVSLPLELDQCVPDDCLWVPGASAATASLGPAYAPVSVEKD